MIHLIYTPFYYEKHRGVSLAAGGAQPPMSVFPIANIISFEQNRVFDPLCIFDAKGVRGDFSESLNSY